MFAYREAPQTAGQKLNALETRGSGCGHCCPSSPHLTLFTLLAFRMLICSSYTVSLFFSRKPSDRYSTWGHGGKQKQALVLQPDLLPSAAVSVVSSHPQFSENRCKWETHRCAYLTCKPKMWSGLTQRELVFIMWKHVFKRSSL